MTTQYIGCRVSLISKNEVRYEGVLYHIDPTKMEVVLKDVQSFGTENRPTDNPVESSQYFPFISFSGDDIKELNVCESPQAQVPEQPMMMHGQDMGYPSPFGYPQGAPFMMHHQFGQYGYGNPYDQYGYYGYDPRVDPMQMHGFYNGYPQMDPMSFGHPPMGEMQHLNQGSGPLTTQADNSNSPLMNPADLQAAQERNPVQEPQPSKQEKTGTSQVLKQPSASKPVLAQPKAQTPAPPPANVQPQPPKADESSLQKPKPTKASQSESVGSQKGTTKETNGASGDHQSSSNRSNQNRNKKRNRSNKRSQNQRNKDNKISESFTEDFDFESSLAKFDKEKFVASISSDKGDLEDEFNEEPVAYEKSSFFDTISCEATDRESEKNIDYRESQKQQRKLDTETFGELGARSNSRGRGRRNNSRGGRRGGRSYYYRKRKNNDSDSNGEKSTKAKETST